MGSVALLILGLSLVGYFSPRVPNVAVTFVALALMAITGLQDITGILKGLSNSAVVTIALMFILSEALVSTGALQPLTVRLGRWSKGNKGRLLLVLFVTVAGGSAFMNNTPIVVMMVPVLMTMCRVFHIVPSKLFLPLSYFAIIGGTCTLIGTSTNLLVDGLSQDLGGPAFGMFDFAPLGLVFVALGGLYMITVGQKLLPERESLTSILPVDQRTSFVTEVVITKASLLIGKKVMDAFPPVGTVKVLELIRNDTVYIGQQTKPMTMNIGDAIILEGDPKDLAAFIKDQQAVPASIVQDDHLVPFQTKAALVCEMVVLPNSSLVGHRVRDLNLHHHYGLKLIAVQRNGRHHRFDLRKMYVKTGDTLLVQTDHGNLDTVRKSGDLLIVDEYCLSKRANKAKVAVATLLIVVTLAALELAPLMVMAFIGAAVVVATGCLTQDEAVGSIDANVLLIMIGTIPMGQALVDTGIIGVLVGLLNGWFGSGHPMIMLAAIYLVCMLLSSILSNATVAVLMTPFVFDLAATTSLSVTPFLMAVAFGANACFVSPIGYQANLIVMGPGGYTPIDYLKVGAPLSLTFWVVGTWLIPVFWPF